MIFLQSLITFIIDLAAVAGLIVGSILLVFVVCFGSWLLFTGFCIGFGYVFDFLVLSPIEFIYRRLRASV